MKYDMKAHPTEYKGVKFRSRLEARWAAFFDLIGWEWEYEPVDLRGWTPDFYVKFPCSHGDCGDYHELYVEVKPYRDVGEFAGHPVNKIDPYSTPAPACFGANPHVTEWQMVHGSGGGTYSVPQRCGDTDIDVLWKRAGNTVQWKPATRPERGQTGRDRSRPEWTLIRVMLREPRWRARIGEQFQDISLLGSLERELFELLRDTPVGRSGAMLIDLLPLTAKQKRAVLTELMDEEWGGALDIGALVEGALTRLESRRLESLLLERERRLPLATGESRQTLVAEISGLSRRIAQLHQGRWNLIRRTSS